MRVSLGRSLGGCLALLAAGCMTLPAPAPTPEPIAKEAVVSAGAVVSRVTLRGVVRSPASLVSNGGGGVIGNNGAGVVSNNGAGAWGPVAGAHVTLTDSFGRALKGVSSATTQDDGSFEVAQVPAGVNVVVEVEWPQGHLTSLVQPAAAMAPVAVTPATTVVTEHLRQALAEEPLALRQVAPAAVSSLTEEVTEALERQEVSLDLTSREQAAQVFAAVVARRPSLGTKRQEILAQAREALSEALRQGELADEPEPLPSMPPAGPSPRVSGPVALPSGPGLVAPSWGPGLTAPSGEPWSGFPSPGVPSVGPVPSPSMPSWTSFFSPMPFPSRSPLSFPSPSF